MFSMIPLVTRTVQIILISLNNYFNFLFKSPIIICMIICEYYISLSDIEFNIKYFSRKICLFCLSVVMLIQSKF